MIVFGGIERARRQDAGLNRRAQLLLCFCTCGLCCRALDRVLHEDRGAVAVAPVTELSAGIGRINRAEEPVQKIGVADLVVIIGDLHRLIMAGSAGRDLLVGRIGRCTAGKARHHRCHAGHGFEIFLDAPEAAPGHHGCLLFRLGGAEPQPQPKNDPCCPDIHHRSPCPRNDGMAQARRPFTTPCVTQG